MWTQHYCTYMSKSEKTTHQTVTYFSCYKHTCTNKYDPQMPQKSNIHQLLHIHMRQICQYHHKHWYAYISHYCYMPLSRYPATLHAPLHQY